MNTNQHLPQDYEDRLARRRERTYRTAILSRTQRNLTRTRRRLAGWAAATTVGVTSIAAVIALIPPGLIANLAALGCGIVTGACAVRAWHARAAYRWDRALCVDALHEVEALPEPEARS